MSFIDSYKRLEKLCGEIMNDDERVTAYIKEMEMTTDGARYVPGWNEDFKKLKHLRWVRNRIAHEPDCNEKNTCEPGDEEWINDFYKRIMNSKDPLTLYVKAKESSQKTTTVRKNVDVKPPQKKKTDDKQNKAGCLVFCGFALMVLILVIIVMKG